MTETEERAVTAPRTRLRELDALRGLAAIGVVLYHYTSRFPEMFPTAPHVGVAFTWGHDSVLLFFAISGFVISFSLDRADSIADFAVKRFARLYPAYWAAMLMTLAVEHASNVVALQESSLVVLANVTMLQNFAYLPGVDGVYWTLGLELAFYMCMLGLWLSGVSKRLEQALLVWLALGVLSWIWPEMPSRVTMLLVLQYIPFFGIGMLSYRVWTGARRWRDQISCIAAILLSIIVQGRFESFVLAVLLLFLFAAMIAGRLRFLATGPLLWFGAISYSLYLVHHDIGFIILLQADVIGMSPWAALGLAFATVLALSVLLHHFVEEPMSRFIADKWASRGTQVALI